MIKQVGETAINPIHQSTCHCGAVELEIRLPDGIVEPRRCNCSICRQKGAVVGSVPLSGLKVVKGKDKLSLYQFDTKKRSIISVQRVASTPITSDGQTQINMG